MHHVTVLFPVGTEFPMHLTAQGNHASSSHCPEATSTNDAGVSLTAQVSCVLLHFCHPELWQCMHTAMHSKAEKDPGSSWLILAHPGSSWLIATGTGRGGCRAWDDPVQGRNTAVVTQHRGVRVPRGRRQLHAGVPFPHEGCAVLLTGRQLLLIGACCSQADTCC